MSWPAGVRATQSVQTQMEYIARADYGWDHRPYWKYLESARTQMPQHIFGFASNTENHDLTSPNSLHDSWLESWNVREPADTATRKHRSIQIDARFLGSRWDRYIDLTYRNVGRHEILSPEGFAQLPSHKTGHGDLLIHEMRIVRDGLFAHELVFSRGSTFLVEFSDFEHRIQLL
jgi:hypothetical protein